MESILTIGLAPAFQKVLVFPSLRENEVNRAVSCTCVASGKGINVTRVLAGLDRPSTNITQLGGPGREEFLKLCRAEGISVRYFLSSSPIRTCTTLINEEKGTSTELVEEAAEVENEASDGIFKLFEDEIDKHAAVIISGTKAKGYSDDLIPSIVKKSTEKGKLTVLDIKGNDLLGSIPFRPSVIKPNLSEFCSTFSIAGDVREAEDNSGLRDAVEKTMRMLYDEYGVCTVISRGRFATWIFDGRAFQSVENTLSLPVVNTIGCGDTLTAVMTDRLLEGRSLEEAVREGMRAAERKASRRTFDFK